VEPQSSASNLALAKPKAKAKAKSEPKAKAKAKANGIKRELKQEPLEQPQAKRKKPSLDKALFFEHAKAWPLHFLGERLMMKPVEFSLKGTLGWMVIQDVRLPLKDIKHPLPARLVIRATIMRSKDWPQGESQHQRTAAAEPKEEEDGNQRHEVGSKAPLRIQEMLADEDYRKRWSAEDSFRLQAGPYGEIDLAPKAYATSLGWWHQHPKHRGLGFPEFERFHPFSSQITVRLKLLGSRHWLLESKNGQAIQEAYQAMEAVGISEDEDLAEQLELEEDVIPRPLLQCWAGRNPYFVMADLVPSKNFGDEVDDDSVPLDQLKRAPPVASTGSTCQDQDEDSMPLADLGSPNALRASSSEQDEGVQWQTPSAASGAAAAPPPPRQHLRSLPQPRSHASASNTDLGEVACPGVLHRYFRKTWGRHSRIAKWHQLFKSMNSDTFFRYVQKDPWKLREYTAEANALDERDGPENAVLPKVAELLQTELHGLSRNASERQERGNLGKGQKLRIADLGCGEAKLNHEIAKLQWDEPPEVTSVDAFALAEGVEVHDIAELPEEWKGTFDAVVLSRSLWGRDYIRVLLEARRILRDDYKGVLVVVEPFLRWKGRDKRRPDDNLLLWALQRTRFHISWGQSRGTEAVLRRDGDPRKSQYKLFQYIVAHYEPRRCVVCRQLPGSNSHRGVQVCVNCQSEECVGRRPPQSEQVARRSPQRSSSRRYRLRGRLWARRARHTEEDFRHRRRRRSRSRRRRHEHGSRHRRHRRRRRRSSSSSSGRRRSRRLLERARSCLAAEADAVVESQTPAEQQAGQEVVEQQQPQLPEQDPPPQQQQDPPPAEQQDSEPAREEAGGADAAALPLVAVGQLDAVGASVGPAERTLPPRSATPPRPPSLPALPQAPQHGVAAWASMPPPHGAAAAAQATMWNPQYYAAAAYQYQLQQWQALQYQRQMAYYRQ